MNPFEMVVIIVIASLFAKLMMNRQKLRYNAMSSGHDEAEFHALRDRLGKLEALEERVRNLEKIVTDRKRNLAEEIDSL